jgi:hypothetical protein
MTEKLARKWRLIGDPFAPESVWLPACAASSVNDLADFDHQIENTLSGATTVASRSTSICDGFTALPWGSGSVSNAVAASLASIFRLTSALLLSGAFAYFACASAQLGFDWGYKLVERIFGQAAEENQSVTSFYALVFAVMPLVFGLVFGFFKSTWSGTRRWYAAYIIVALCYCINVCLPDNLEHLFSSSRELLPAIPSFVFGLIGLSTGVCIYSALRRRMRLLPIVLSGFAALVPAFYVLQSPITLVGEIAVYSLPLIIGSACAAYFARARDRVGAMLMAMVALLPIILVNFGNVACNLISLCLDNFQLGADLSWRALMSACLISMLTFVCAGIGGLIGFRLRERSH